MIKASEIVPLAMKIKEIYPSGLRPGTTKAYSASTPDIASMIYAFIDRYKDSFDIMEKAGHPVTAESIEGAVKNYVKARNGDWSRIKNLENFILDYDKSSSFLRSELMQWIESGEQTEYSPIDYSEEII